MGLSFCLRNIFVIFAIYLLCQANNEYKNVADAAVYRVKRQDQLEKAPDMKPWGEMGMKYGLLAATEIIIPMGMEMMNNSQKS